jgi:hypothetical protein
MNNKIKAIDNNKVYTFSFDDYDIVNAIESTIKSMPQTISDIISTINKFGFNYTTKTITYQSSNIDF